jgi:hypothetical protein
LNHRNHLSIFEPYRDFKGLASADGPFRGMPTSGTQHGAGHGCKRSAASAADCAADHPTGNTAADSADAAWIVFDPGIGKMRDGPERNRLRNPGLVG